MSTHALPSTDCHTHVGVDAAFYLAGWLPYASSAQDLLEHMEQAGIDRAVCFPNPTSAAFDPWVFAEERRLQQIPGRVPYVQENAVLVREMRLVDPGGRLLPFAMFDPGRDVRAQIDGLQKLADGLRGMKSQPTLLQSPVRRLLDEARPLMEFAEQHDLPIVLHTSVDPTDRWSQAMDCLEVAAAYPNVRFSLAHSLRFDVEALSAASGLGNVWVDCSAHLLHCELARADSPAVAPPGRRVDVDYGAPHEVLTAVSEILGGKYLWGSDSPYQSWADDSICSVYRYSDEMAVLGGVSEAVRDSMLRLGPQAWLGGVAPR